MYLLVPGVFALLQQLGEIKTHPNILMIVQSLDNVEPLPTSQITILTVDTLLNSTKLHDRTFDLVYITGNVTGPCILEILDVVAGHGFKIWADWTESFEDFEMTMMQWDIIRARAYGVNSYLYFHIVSKNMLIEVYCISGLKIMAVVIDFENESEDSIASVTSIARRRRNFQQVQVTGHHVRKWNMKTKTGLQTVSWNNETSGPSHQYLAYSQDFLNFSLETKSSTAYAVLDKTGNWIGLAKHILQGESDLSISAAAMVSRLAQDVRFLSSTLPIERVNLNYLSSPPSKVGMYSGAFHPFVWHCILGALVIFLILIVPLTKSWVGEIEADQFWWIFAWFSLKGNVQIKGKPTSFRCIAVTISIFAYIIYSTFSGSLISTISNLKRNVDEIDSLIEKGYTFGLLNDSYMAALMTTNTTWTAKLMAHLDVSKPFASREDGANEVLQNPRYVFVTGQEVYQFLSQILVHDRICPEYRVVSLKEYSVGYSSFVRKDSQFAEHFNFARLIMRETGIAQLFVRKKSIFINSFKPDCPVEKGLPFSLKDVVLPFQIWMSGAALSLIMLGISILFSWIKYYSSCPKNEAD